MSSNRRSVILFGSVFMFSFRFCLLVYLNYYSPLSCLKVNSQEQIIINQVILQAYGILSQNPLYLGDGFHFNQLLP